jgi:hypothetical protein
MIAYDTAFDEGPKIELRNRFAFTRLAPVVEGLKRAETARMTKNVNSRDAYDH